MWTDYHIINVYLGYLGHQGAAKRGGGFGQSEKSRPDCDRRSKLATPGKGTGEEALVATRRPLGAQLHHRIQQQPGEAVEVLGASATRVPTNPGTHAIGRTGPRRGGAGSDPYQSPPPNPGTHAMGRAGSPRERRGLGRIPTSRPPPTLSQILGGQRHTEVNGNMVLVNPHPILNHNLPPGRDFLVFTYKHPTIINLLPLLAQTPLL